MILKYFNKENSIPIIVFVLSLLFSIYAYFPTFTNQYAIADDARTCTYWMRQFQDPELFKNDFLTDYAKEYQPLGYYALFYIASFFADPISFSNFLTLILVALTGFYFYKLMYVYIENKNIAIFGGIIACIALITSQTFIGRMAGGLPRTFAYPLMIAFLYYLSKKDNLSLIFVLAAQVLFYPIISLISIISWCLSMTWLMLLSIFKRSSIPKKDIKLFIIGIILALFLISVKYLRVANPSIGETFTKVQIKNEHPELLLNGRIGPLVVPPMKGIFINEFFSGNRFFEILFHYGQKIFKLSKIAHIFDIVLVILLFIVIVECSRRKIKFPPGFFSITISSIIMYKIADIFFIKFHLPSRYFKYSISICSVILIVVVICNFLSKVSNKYARISIQACICLLLIFNISLQYDRYLYTKGAENKDLWSYLKTLPKDAVIAAPPYLADDIPMFSQRIIFLGHEISHPMYDKYWETIELRTGSFFYAYYSNDLRIVYSFMENFNIDYLIVEKRLFSSGYLMKKHFYYEPFNSYIKKLVSGRTDFVLDALPDKFKLYENDNFYVTSKQKIFKDIVSLQKK